MFIWPYLFSLFYLQIGGGPAGSPLPRYLIPTTYFHYNPGASRVSESTIDSPSTERAAGGRRESRELRAHCQPRFRPSGLCLCVKDWDAHSPTPLQVSYSEEYSRHNQSGQGRAPATSQCCTSGLWLAPDPRSPAISLRAVAVQPLPANPFMLSLGEEEDAG